MYVCICVCIDVAIIMCQILFQDCQEVKQEYSFKHVRLYFGIICLQPSLPSPSQICNFCCLLISEKKQVLSPFAQAKNLDLALDSFLS